MPTNTDNAYRAAGLLKREEARRFLGWSMRSLERRYQNPERYPDFPRPIQEPSSREVLFREAELAAYVRNLPALERPQSESQRPRRRWRKRTAPELVRPYKDSAL